MNLRDGYCYPFALMAIINGEAGMLVHGVVDGYGPHAWIENGETVHDVVSNTWFQIDQYPGRCVSRYNREEALWLALEFLHCGPWPTSNSAITR